jgi:peroxiredoxin
MPQFEAAGAQVLGVSADHVATLDAFAKQNPLKQGLASDFRRTMLPAYDAMVTDEKSPMYRYGKRAYFIIDSKGIVRYVKVMDNPLDLLQPEDLLKALKDSKAS